MRNDISSGLFGTVVPHDEAHNIVPTEKNIKRFNIITVEISKKKIVVNVLLWVVYIKQNRVNAD